VGGHGPEPRGRCETPGVTAALFGDVYIKIGGSYVDPDQGRQIVEEIDGRL
jgi:hypothetical protein